MQQKYLGGNLDRNIAFGLCWLLSAITGLGFILALVIFIVDSKNLTVDDKRELVSLFITMGAFLLLGVTILVPMLCWVCFVIATIMAFTGKTFKIPGAYHLAAAFIK